MSKYYLKFDCPDFVEGKTVLELLQKELVKLKCTLYECGTVETLEKLSYRKSTGVLTGQSLPPKYNKRVTKVDGGSTLITKG